MSPIRQRVRAAVLVPLALLVASGAVVLPPAQAQQRCDEPLVGDVLPVDVALPHDLSTGHDVGVAVVDTGASAPGVVTERPGDRDHCLLHGTAVTGVLRTVAPGARVVSVRQGDGSNTTVADLVDALDRARTTASEHGVRILNVSVVACEDTAELRRAVDAVEREGLLLVAAAGNAGQCRDDQVPYPAALPGVLTVGGVDAREPDTDPGTDPDAGRRPADYSVPGEWVDLHAPGGPVSATLQTDGTDRTIVGDPAPFSGTSFASPVVAGTAALVWQLRPELSAAEVRALLVDTAEQGVVPVVSPVAAVGAVLDRAGSAEIAGHAEAAAHYEMPAEVSVVRAVDVPADLRVPLALAGVVAVAILTALILRVRR
ncbi:MAG: S8 family serine peptidase [Corynebacterium sp.]|uniref:S8 family serine peptidase n=1 Tax=unclassified Corynebacterium TaxID=2624378 RepID=UPI0026493825|nr:S8 family serine peptidase [Corynebacterium sp.]MDN5581301.1 S8 family serine peptidase [Corynebacterium sp.]MDN5720045.1 S8 family serine peptidase [Corynebacterium sp.]MDN6259261.1 S8 family serine peptidase [Corynebacterium sp.]MDN6324870.1 S8 family serine peptidase [Corynebacterium sp.]